MFAISNFIKLSGIERISQTHLFLYFDFFNLIRPFEIFSLNRSQKIFRYCQPFPKSTGYTINIAIKMTKKCELSF